MIRLLPLIGLALSMLPVASGAAPAYPSAIGAASLAGGWKMDQPILLTSPNGRQANGAPQCLFQQEGTTLTGGCKLAGDGEGPVTGKVIGRHVEFQWRFAFCGPPKTKAKAKAPATTYGDRFVTTGFKGELGTDNVLHGNYQSRPGGDWDKSFLAKKSQPDMHAGCL